jgi:hypothetical protein
MPRSHRGVNGAAPTAAASAWLRGRLRLRVERTRASAVAPAGTGAVLKVGKVGASSGPRFNYQHYGFAAQSTLARSLIKYRFLWPWLGIADLDERNVKDWMLSNMDRVHFFLPGAAPEVLSSLEVYVRARIGSAFEGSA